jgi:Fuc2NAc and GlcNAc transferase
MMSMALLVAVAAIAVAIATAISTGVVLRFAIARGVLDMPNERSSHTQPTPRGGGLAIAGVLFAALLVACLMGAAPWRLTAALIVGGVPIAAVGWIDDRRGVAARVRFAVHLASASAAVALLGGMPTLRVGADSIALGPLGSVLAVVAITWLINLYNFMDGIDGIAAGEAVTVGVSAAVLGFTTAPAVALASLLVAACALGFLRWNWPPARIFMGDVSSGLLGFVFGALALASERAGGPPALLWLLLLGVFIADATVTLVRRMRRGERWYAAHRLHAYQRLTRHGWTHRGVSSSVLIVNVALAMIATAAMRLPSRAPLLLASGVALLTGLLVAVERIAPMPPAERE